jgi:hypothetical protein
VPDKATANSKTRWSAFKTVILDGTWWSWHLQLNSITKLILEAEEQAGIHLTATKRVLLG